MKPAIETAKHTPGPWEISDTDFGCIAILEFSPDKTLTVSPCNRSATIAEREANARLIAAAPELLEALENLLSYPFQAKLGDQVAKNIFAAQQAIRKAKGEL